jgi:hypothetical protein
VTQHKLSAETVDKKFAVLNHLDSAGMPATIVAFYSELSGDAQKGMCKTILRWRHERSKLEEAAAADKGAHSKVRSLGVATILSDALEMEIVTWVNELREDGVPVSTLMLADKARQVAREAEVTDFKGSDKWVMGFKRRHQFTLRAPTRQSQISPVDIDLVAAAFAATVEATVREVGITRVFNADQTGKKFNVFV